MFIGLIPGWNSTGRMGGMGPERMSQCPGSIQLPRFKLHEDHDFEAPLRILGVKKALRAPSAIPDSSVSAGRAPQNRAGNGPGNRTRLSESLALTL